MGIFRTSSASSPSSMEKRNLDIKNYMIIKNLTKKILLLAVSVFMTATVLEAEVPTGYYSTLNGKKEGELKTAVYNLVRNFTHISSYQNLPQYFQRTDVYPNSKRWWDMYSDIPLYAPSFSGLNREHSFPKSWWGGSTEVSAYIDLNHLYPSEMAANTAKNNYPLGEVNRNQSIKFQNGVTTVGYPVAGQGGGAQSVFEPADEYKGDFARTYFYMVTCYQDLTWKYFYMVAQNTYPTLTTWAQNLLLKWHRQDPVSEKEIMRNEEVYKIQNNRNPFIDYPELAEYIWGDKKGQVFNVSTSTTPSGTPNLITPVQDMSLDFGQVVEGKSVTAQLWFNGENLNAAVNLRVYTGDATYFTTPVSSISAANINSADGYMLTMTYKPGELGEHTSRLLIQGGGVQGSRGISLHGECVGIPTLTAPVALAATEITDSTYVANWIPADDEVVDYYVINRTKYSKGSVTNEQIVAEEPATLIEDFLGNDSETYTVQSARLGYFSDESNPITVNNPAGTTAVGADEPWGVANIPGGMRFLTSGPVKNIYIFDAAGRMVMQLNDVDSYTDIYVEQGVYFVKSTAGAPVKVLVRD